MFSARKWEETRSNSETTAPGLALKVDYAKYQHSYSLHYFIILLVSLTFFALSTEGPIHGSVQEESQTLIIISFSLGLSYPVSRFPIT
jgi:hypothetical protein